MEEPVVTQEVPKVETPVVEVPKTVDQKVETPKEDLVSRVAKFKPEAPKKEESNSLGLTKEVYDRVMSNPDTVALYKSMQADYTRKTQELAEKMKDVERKVQPQGWTPERIQQLLNDPQFVQAAQQVATTQTPKEQEYSALNETEKTEIRQAREEARKAQLQLWQLEQRRQDEMLRTKYANYNPESVDILTAELLAGKVQATKEHLFKVIDYDDAVRRAYELGKQDKQLDTKEKQQSSSPEGFSATPTQDIPKQEQGESNTAYFRRLALRRMVESGKK